MKAWRIIIMGTGPFAVPSAESLYRQGCQIPLVVTRPLPQPIPKKCPPRPIAQWATGHGLPLFEPVSINAPAAVEQLRSYQADLFFVCDYGQILSADCLAASRLGGVNLHGSLLPRHRGAAPVQWTLLSGDRQAGVSAIHMTPRLDAGPILATRATDIHPAETAADLEPRLAELGSQVTLEAVELLARWDGSSPLGQLQDAALVTRAPRFRKQDGQLDFRLPAEYLARLIRACQPWPGTFADLAWSTGKSLRVLVRSAQSMDCQVVPGGTPGAVQVIERGEIESTAADPRGVS